MILSAAFLYESFAQCFFVLEVKKVNEKMGQLRSKNFGQIDSRLLGFQGPDAGGGSSLNNPSAPVHTLGGGIMGRLRDY
jgi:hypothetical protein